MEENKTRYHINHAYLSSPLKFNDVYLIQIGRRFCEPFEVVEAHPHFKWFELTVVTAGKGTIITNGDAAVVKSGEIYLSFPCDIHEIRADLGERFEYDFFSFFCEDKRLGDELKRITREYNSENSRIFTDGKISRLIKNAISEFPYTDEEYSSLILSDIFHLVILYLIKAFDNAKKFTENVSEAEILCFSLMNYIDTHIYSIESLTDITKRFNYNYGYLSGLFKKTTGKTLSEYAKHRKMENARVLVLEKKKKIGEIAEMLGYNLYSFSKAFKSKYGISPKTMQKGKE